MGVTLTLDKRSPLSWCFPLVVVSPEMSTALLETWDALGAAVKSKLGVAADEMYWTAEVLVDAADDDVVETLSLSTGTVVLDDVFASVSCFVLIPLAVVGGFFESRFGVVVASKVVGVLGDAALSK